MAATGRTAQQRAIRCKIPPAASRRASQVRRLPGCTWGRWPGASTDPHAEHERPARRGSLRNVGRHRIAMNEGRSAAARPLIMESGFRA